MTNAVGEDEGVVDKLREEIDLTESNLSGAMQGIADCYRELQGGFGRGYGVHAKYRESNVQTGRPLTELAVELAAWAAEIAAKSAALDVRRALLKQLEDED
ncbi:hypothetical protein P3T36_006318 [Kitasatospora sp. MAP12-15]|uniref:hypothetical protein n=1 Tax=unclassified Kitasatospora TaxID=2633591 RepID=UPI002476F689|nr:hypothetical protein [Kitasatospora sp. MAP12-44]MDH6107859.1 hypothetical protein [Kitasatospora sp. MAP12-44]